MSSKKENIKPGYKQTSIGWIPMEWKIDKLSNNSKIIMGQSPSSHSYNIDGIGPLLIQGNADIKNRESSPRIYTSEPTKHCEIGDILLSVRAPVGTIAKSNHKASIGRGICAIRPKPDFSEFIYQYLLFFELKWTKFEQGSTFQAINTNDIKSLNIPVPTFQEQQKIAAILSTWDEAILKQRKLVDQTRNRNKSLTQKLLSGNKRLSGFNDNWKTTSVSEVVDRVKNSFKPELTKLYEQIGIRSHTKGLFYKEPVSGKDLGNKSVFWIEPNCFIVNIVFAWEHAIAKTTKKEIGMIASHRFPMFKPKAELMDLDYLLNYFKSAKGKDLLGLASPGGAGRNKTLGQSDFLKLPILLPSLEEQQAISTVIEQATTELKIQEQHLAFLQSQKKGLMQKLLTGEIRVNVNTK